MNSKRLLTLFAGLLLLVAPALVWAQNAQDSIIVESKTVAPGSAATPLNANPPHIMVRVSFTNKDTLANITVPLLESSLSGGAYGYLSYGPNNPGDGGPGPEREDDGTDTFFPLLTAPQLSTVVCNYNTYHSTPPDTVMWTGTASPPTGARLVLPSAGTPLARVRRNLIDIAFDTVLANLGQFQLDSGRVLTNTIQHVTRTGVSVPVNFVKGIITVSVPPCLFTNCPGSLSVLYGRALSFNFNTDCEAAASPVTYSITAGPAGSAINATNGGFTWPGQCALSPGLQLIVRATNPFNTFSECTTSIIVFDNAPTCTPANLNVSVSHGQIATNQVNTNDVDPGDNVTVMQTSGVGTTSPSGAWSYQTSCANVGAGPLTVQEQVQDGFGICQPGPMTNSCSFTLTVTNDPPSVTCPNNASVQAGNLYSQCPGSNGYAATDPDPADANLNYTGIAVPPLTGFSVHPVTGCISAAPLPGDAGPHTITLTVTDSCGRTAQCSYTLTVVVGAPFRICIDKIGPAGVFQGTDVEVSIRNLVNAVDPDVNSRQVGGFSFLLSYDCSCLQFLSARKGALLVSQGWEFFTYRFGAVGNGNCGAGCPTCLLRIVAIYDVNNGAAPVNASPGINNGQWAVLKFRISNDRTLAGQCCQISWFWFDCTDNTISDSTGNVLYVADSLYSESGAPIDLATAFPNNVKNCDQFSGGPGKPSPKKRIIFCNGAICIPTPEQIDDRGDLNLNGLGYEIADAVLYENYFIYGASVLQPNPQRQSQIAASDVNGDGNPLTVADLVALIRVITGDANPLPKAIPGAAVAIAMTSSGSEVTLSANSISDLGGLHLTFKVSGTVGGVALSEAAEGMTVKTNVNGDELSVLIFSEKRGAMIAPNAGAIFTLSVDGSVELMESEASDYFGALLPTLAKGPALPTSFGLSQNYPNPFNAKTNIQLALPVASDYTVTVYNVAGQVVKTFSGNAAAGSRTIVWDGTDNNGTGVSSGVYFYKAVAGKFSATKKMLLLQ